MVERIAAIRRALVQAFGHSHLVNVPLIQPLHTVLAWLSPRRRRDLAVVAALSLLGSAAELASIGAVLPFLGVLANADSVSRYPVLRALLERVEGTSALAMAALLFVLIVCLAAVVRIAVTYATTRFANDVGHDLAVRIHGRLLRQPYAYHVARNSSEVLSGVEKVGTVVNGVLMPALDGATSLVFALAIIGGLLTVDWITAVSAAVLFGLSYLAISRVSRARLVANGSVIARQGTVRLKALQESLGGIRDVLLDGSQPYHEQRFSRADAAQRRAITENTMWAQVPRWAVEAVGVAIIALLAVVAARRAGGMSAALPVLGAVALGAQRLLPLFQRSYQAWNSLQGTHAVLADVVALADLPVAVGRAMGDPAQLPFREALELRNVGFRYGQSLPWVLRGVDQVIPRGSRVGFAGETGCGKSTLLDLVMGLLEPTEGCIAVDGAPLTAENRPHWQARIAHVPQSIYLTDSTIAENIAFGEPPDRIDHARVEEAARRAAIHAFIAGLSHGYATEVGERGVRLSGGQRQRIGIARALYRRADVLVLDEATSALDGRTEASVMEAISELGGDVTVLMVAHRITTLELCDRVIHLERGGLLRSEAQQRPHGPEASTDVPLASLAS